MACKKRREELLEVYRRLRAHFGHRHWWPGETPLEVMVGAILTQNTAWTNVEKAIANLKRAKVLNAQKLLDLSDGQLAELLRPSGYFNIKTRRLKSFLRYFMERHGGSVARMRAVPLLILRREILDVHGVGPETADSILLYALGKRTFVVDAYTRRIFSRIGWVAPEADYHDIQAFFAGNLPPKVPLFNDYHAQIVQLGKDVCRQKPRCPVCPLKNLCGWGGSAG